MAWSKDDEKTSKNATDIVNEQLTIIELKQPAVEAAINAGEYIESKRPLIEQSITDAATAKTTAETVKSQFDQVVAEAGSNNPEVVLARGGEVNLNTRINKVDQRLANTVLKKTIYVSQYLIVPPEIDDTQRIIRAIADCTDGDKLVLKGIFSTSAKITVNRAIEWDSKNATINSNHVGICLEFVHATRTNFGDGESYRLKVTIGSIKKFTRNITDSSIGILIVNSYFGEFKLGLIENFTTQVSLKGTTHNGSPKGTAYNTIFLGRLQNHKIGIEFTNDLGGWVTENAIYGGSFGGIGEIGSTHILISGSDISYSNNNKFYNPSLEGSHEEGIKITNSANNSFYEPRFEMPKATKIIEFGGGTQANRIMAGYGVDNQIAKIIDTGRYNRISSTGYSSRSFEYFDGEFFSFTKPGGSGWGELPVGKQTPIGGVPVRAITSSDGTLTLDLSRGRHFYVIVNADITTITMSNVPEKFVGMEFSVHFAQNNESGFTITGFPWAFGTKSTPPTSRSFGKDVYDIKAVTSGSGQMFYCMNHFAS